MKMLARKQIIESWSKQSEEHLNSFCCPDCREILVPVINGLLNNYMVCENDQCRNVEYYNKTILSADTAEGPDITVFAVGGRNAGKREAINRAIEASEKINLNCSCNIDARGNFVGVALHPPLGGVEITPLKIVEVIDIDPMMVKK